MADCLFVLYVLFVCGYSYVALDARFEKFRFEIYKAFLEMFQYAKKKGSLWVEKIHMKKDIFSLLE